MKKLLVGLFAVAMVVAFTAPAMAEWNFYGSARMSTFYEIEDNSANDDRTSLTWDKQGNSRFGAKVKANDNGIGGRFEYGTGVNLRLLYGTWDFGGGTLLLGQDYTPSCSGNAWISNQVWGTDNDLIWYGMPYIGRKPQIKLKVGTFSVALIQPNTPLLPGYVGGADTVGGTEVATVPMLELSYELKTDMFFFRPYAGYNTYEIEQTDGKDESINAWLGGFTFGVTPGAFYLKGGAFYSLNPGAYGVSMETGQSTAYDQATRNILEVNAWGGQLLAGFKISDTVTVETGGGFASYDQDNPDEDILDVLDRDADATDWSVYLNASITLAPGFFVVPEFGFRDREDIGDNNNDVTYIGAKWQINF